MLRKEVEEFDEAFPDGVFAFPPDPQEPGSFTPNSNKK